MVGSVAFGDSWDLRKRKSGKDRVTKDPKWDHQFFQDQEAVGPLFGPFVGFLAPQKIPGSGDQEIWVPVLTLPLLAK